MAARPRVLPEPFSGVGSWDQWKSHFEDVAALNEWDAAEKLLWLKVRLTGRARTAFQRLSEEARETYEGAMLGLRERFEPASKRELYLAELQSRKKQSSEGWAEFAEDLRLLVDKAYPTLQDVAREHIALTHYLGQLSNSQVAFSVKQTRPKDLDAAVTATLEMESYTIPQRRSGVARVVDSAEDSSIPSADADLSVAATRTVSDSRLLPLLEDLAERMAKLETHLQDKSFQPPRHTRQPRRRGPPLPGGPRGSSPSSATGNFQPPSTRSPVVCYRCGQEGHFARGCAAFRGPQGN